MNYLNTIGSLSKALLAVWLICTAGLQAAIIRVLAFDKVSNEGEILVLDQDGRPVDEDPLVFHTRQLSAGKKVEARTLQFMNFADFEADESDLESIPKMAQVTLPAAGNEFILVFLPDKKGRRYPYVVHALPIAVEKFKAGSQAFVNYYPREVAFDFGKEKMRVPVGQAGIYTPSDMKSKHFILGYAMDKEGRWEKRPFFSSRMIVQSKVRNLIFILNDPRTERPVFRGITDFAD